jgi:hypothetical protein
MRRALALPALLSLAACGGPEPGAGWSADWAEAEAPTLAFARGFGAVTPSAPLVAGGQVRLTYDRQRLYDIVNKSSSVGYFASTYHCYGYGCCEVEFAEVYAQVRFGDGAFTTYPVDEAGEVQVSLPRDAGRLEVYFEAPGYQLRTWYCGCDAACAAENKARSGFGFHAYATYDSRFGENYRFDVAPAPAPEVTRLADGEWLSNYATPSGVRYGWLWDSNVWVDLAVPADAQPERVGVRWTVDGWQTFTDSEARFEGTRPDGQAQWGVDITPAKRMQSCYWCRPAPVTFEYAAFMTVGGVTVWDNNEGANHALPLRVAYE